MEERDLIKDKMRVDDLTWREQEILILLSERMTNREIADRLNLAESTVKDYVGKILSKFYVKNRREAVERARGLGFLENDSQSGIKSRTNLPAESTPFVGRFDELEKIRGVPIDSRLVSLTGPGGIGKTRLALKAAEEASGNFANGIFFVNLAPIHSPEDIVQAVAEAIKFPVATPERPLAQLLRYLSKRQLLLVMDNFEHLLDGVELVNEILQAAPGVKIIATSQEKLNLHSETNINVGGMAIPDQSGSIGTTNNDAISLFMQSAKKVNPEYAPSKQQLVQIGRICKTVDGMPLAIEMAASWLHVLSEDEIADELRKGIDILETEARDVPGRHRSMRAVFDHSWLLLNSSEQELLMFLSVFRGGFTRDAAQEVAEVTLKQLGGFVNKSFISHNLNSGRYQIHELLRQYAEDKLASTPRNYDTAKESHSAYFAEFMETRWPQLRSSNQLTAMQEIEVDIANIRNAWEFLLAQADAAQLHKFMHSFWFIYLVHGWNHAAVELFAEAGDTLSDETDDEESLSVRALAMGLQAYFMAWLGLSEQGYVLSLESVKILEQLDRPLDLAKVLDGLSLNSYYLAHLEDEERAMQRIYEIATEYHDDSLLAYCLFLWSLIDRRKMSFSEGNIHANASLKLFEDLGDTFSSGWSLLSLGGLALANQEFTEAGRYFRKCLRISEKFGYLWLGENASKYLGKIALLRNELEEAEYYLTKSMEIAQETGLGREKANLLYEFSILRANQNRKEEAVELLSFVLKLPESNLARIEGGSIQDNCLLLIAKLENYLPQQVYSSAVNKGQGLVLDEVILELIRPNS